MKKLLFIPLILTVFCCRGIEPVGVSPDEILFLAHFNASLKPEIGRTAGMEGTGELTSGSRGFPFRNSVPAPEALNLTIRDGFIVYPAMRNFDTRAGTLQMLIRPKWKAGYNHCRFFSLNFGKADHAADWRGINSFFIQKPAKSQIIELNQDGNMHGISGALPPGGQTWIQLTATWSIETGKMQFYINGAPAGERKFFPMTQEPTEILFGYPKMLNAQSLIDEVRILNRPLTAGEVKQDYDWLMAGNEFPGGEVCRNSIGSFEPIPVRSSDKDGRSEYLPIEFPCLRISDSIAIDGKLDEPAWQQAKIITGLGIAREGVKRLPPPTEIRVLHDKNAFYISAFMHDEDMAHHIAQYDQNDLSIYNDDCLEFFLATSSKRDDFYQFCVNSLGSVYDSRDGKKGWNAGAKVAGTRQENGWTVEMRIPYDAFGRTTPQPGEVWGAKFCREHHHGVPSVSIPLRDPDKPFNQRNNLGKLIFTLGNNSETSVKCNASDFSLGLNKLTFPTEGQWPEKTEVAIYQTDENGICLNQEKRIVDTGKEIALSVPVTTDAAAKLIFVFRRIENGESLGSVFLDRNFLAASPGLNEMESELEDMEAALYPIHRIKHPVYESALAALARMKGTIREYKEELAKAVEEGRVLPLDQINGFEAALNGFQKFRDDHLFLVWETSPWENGSPNQLPPMDYTPLKALEFQQASNEREARTFIIAGLFSRSRLDVRVVVHPANKGNPNTVFIPESAFEITTEPFINHFGSKMTGPLVENQGNIITLTPGEAIRVRVTCNSRGIPPGNYRTTLFIKPLHEFQYPNYAMDLFLQVWNFTLPETCDWPIIGYFSGPGYFQNDETSVLKLMHSRHVKWIFVKAKAFTDGLNADRMKRLPKGVTFNEEATLHENEEFFRTAKALKMRFMFGWGTTNSYDWHAAMSKRLYDMGFTDEDFAFHALLLDEFLKKDIPVQAKYREEFTRKGCPWQFRATYITTPPPAGATLQDLKEAKLPEFFKLWGVAASFFDYDKVGKRGCELRDFLRSYGCRIWAYRCTTGMIALPLLNYYRSLPWLAWNFKLDGCSFWTYFTDNQRNLDSFDYRDGCPADGITKMDGRRRPVPTKQLEAVCEGLEDVAYADILLKTLKKHPELTKEERDELTALATTKLNEIRLAPSQKAIDEWRLKTGQAIDRLTRRER
ncbi:MAG: hypothetical protein J5944_10815 [Lentisphaeria bacterium]|nr:hypothetical protein [Lentisphaeria bacterium]